MSPSTSPNAMGASVVRPRKTLPGCALRHTSPGRPRPMRSSARFLLYAAAFAALGCTPSEDPPGRTADAVHPAPNLRRPATEAEDATPSVASSKEDSEPGHGAKIASIAMRT